MKKARLTKTPTYIRQARPAHVHDYHTEERNEQGHRFLYHICNACPKEVVYDKI